MLSVGLTYSASSRGAPGAELDPPATDPPPSLAPGVLWSPSRAFAATGLTLAP